MFRAMNAESKRRRRVNTENSTQLLQSHNIPFDSRNDGSHLIVAGYDFWPSTGLFISRDTEKRRGRGVKNLIKLIEQQRSGACVTTTKTG